MMANEVTYYFSGSAITKRTEYFEPTMLILFGKFCFKSYTLMLLKCSYKLQKDSLKYGMSWFLGHVSPGGVTSSFLEWGNRGLTLFLVKFGNFCLLLFQNFFNWLL